MNADKKWFGFWRVNPSSDAYLPELSAWIDPTWNPNDKDKILAYLENSPMVVASTSVRTPCLICDEALNSSNFQSDGVWLWPEDLKHYIHMHHVKIPSSFENHIRQNEYAPPKGVKATIDELPWP